MKLTTKLLSTSSVILLGTILACNSANASVGDVAPTSLQQQSTAPTKCKQMPLLASGENFNGQPTVLSVGCTGDTYMETNTHTARVALHTKIKPGAQFGLADLTFFNGEFIGVGGGASRTVVAWFDSSEKWNQKEIHITDQNNQEINLGGLKEVIPVHFTNGEQELFALSNSGVLLSSNDGHNWVKYYFSMQQTGSHIWNNQQKNIKHNITALSCSSNTCIAIDKQPDGTGYILKGNIASATNTITWSYDYQPGISPAEIGKITLLTHGINELNATEPLFLARTKNKLFYYNGNFNNGWKTLQLPAEFKNNVQHIIQISHMDAVAEPTGGMSQDIVLPHNGMFIIATIDKKDNSSYKSSVWLLDDKFDSNNQLHLTQIRVKDELRDITALNKFDTYNISPEYRQMFKEGTLSTKLSPLNVPYASLIRASGVDFSASHLDDPGYTLSLAFSPCQYNEQAEQPKAYCVNGTEVPELNTQTVNNLYGREVTQIHRYTINASE